MERRIIFLPAFDRTDPDPKKNYGVGCLDMLFSLTGEKGVVEFELLTNWFLDHVMKKRTESVKRDVRYGKEDFLIETWIKPRPLDVCYFSLEKIWEDDVYFESGIARYFNNKPCYYGYRYQTENEGETDENWTTDFIYWKLITEGDEAVWKFLEEYYQEVFENKEQYNDQ